MLHGCHFPPDFRDEERKLREIVSFAPSSAELSCFQNFPLPPHLEIVILLQWSGEFDVKFLWTDSAEGSPGSVGWLGVQKSSLQLSHQRIAELWVWAPLRKALAELQIVHTQRSLPFTRLRMSLPIISPSSWKQPHSSVQTWSFTEWNILVTQFRAQDKDGSAARPRVFFETAGWYVLFYLNLDSACISRFLQLP